MPTRPNRLHNLLNLNNHSDHAEPMKIWGLTCRPNNQQVALAVILTSEPERANHHQLDRQNRSWPRQTSALMPIKPDLLQLLQPEAIINKFRMSKSCVLRANQNRIYRKKSLQ